MIKGDSKLLVKLLKEIGILNNVRSLVYKFEDLLDKNLLVRNMTVKEIHQGARCFVLGTGSSLSDFDLSYLANEYSFGGNFINYHQDFQKLELNYFISTPSSSLLESIHSKLTYFDSPCINKEEDINKWLNSDLRLCRYPIDPKTFFRNIEKDLKLNSEVFLGAGCKKFIENNNLFQNNKVYYIKPGIPLLHAKEVISDITKRITLFDNAVFAMISIAIFMGFKEIYLLGNDYTFEPAREFHFYDSLCFSKNIKKETAKRWMECIAAVRGTDLFMIEEDKYFYKPIYTQKNKSRKTHMILNDYLESLGIKVFNIVPDFFESPIYEKISWRAMVNKLEGSIEKE